MSLQNKISKIVETSRLTSTKILILAILASISTMAYLSYRELSNLSTTNADMRLERATITAELLAKHWFPEIDDRKPGSGNIPDRITLAVDSFDALPNAIARFEGLTQEVSKSNQGAANIFVWDSSERHFDRIVTTMRKPDGSMPPAFHIGAGHPAFESISNSRHFRGDVPVAGRQRYAFLLPIVGKSNNLVGVLAFDVGWSDDLLTNRNNLRDRLLLIAGGTCLLLLGAAYTSRTISRAPIVALHNALASQTEFDTSATLRGLPSERREMEDIASTVFDLRRKAALMKEKMRVDPLTGCGNRQRFDDDLAHISKQHLSANRNGCIILIDLDDFKQVNDELGHPAGDQVLKTVAERVEALLPSSATLCRNGGDEFAIIGEISNVEMVAEAIIAEIERPMTLGADSASISASLGLLLLDGADHSPHALYKMADEALYSAKRNGKGCFSISGAGTERRGAA